jgi:DNA-binding PadR family transcriptional regulator
MTTPSDLEHQLLLAVWQLGQDAYGVTVRDELEQRTGRAPTLGAIYTTMVRLEKKGWLTSSLSDPTPVRGGKAKRYFTITDDGIEGLRQARQAFDRLWDGLPAESESPR